jgi:MFS family permease
MVSELSTKKTQAQAFSYFAFASNLGIFFGPLVGALANPTKQYPKIFGNIKFFQDWPYILPTVVAGFICAITCMTNIFFVKEVFCILVKDIRSKANIALTDSKER